jgi:hypothetical protein
MTVFVMTFSFLINNICGNISLLKQHLEMIHLRGRRGKLKISLATYKNNPVGGHL